MMQEPRPTLRLPENEHRGAEVSFSHRRRERFPRLQQEVPSTDLPREEPCKDTYLSPQIELLSLETFQRDCTFHFEFWSSSGTLPGRAEF
jgi:hypothetical protein